MTANRKLSVTGTPDTQQKINIQAWGAVAVASLFVSVVEVGRLNWRAVLIFLITFCLLGGMWMFFRYLLNCRRNLSALQREERILSEIASIPVETARYRAEEVLKENRKFLCQEDPVEEFPDSKELPPLLKSVFKRYKRITVKNGDGVLSRETIVPSSHILHGRVVGNDMEECDLIVEKSREVIYETDGSEKSKHSMRQYPTVFHWILAQDRFIYGEQPPSTARR